MHEGHDLIMFGGVSRGERNKMRVPQPAVRTQRQLLRGQIRRKSLMVPACLPHSHVACSQPALNEGMAEAPVSFVATSGGASVPGTDAMNEAELAADRRRVDDLRQPVGLACPLAPYRNRCTVPESAQHQLLSPQSAREKSAGPSTPSAASPGTAAGSAEACAALSPAAMSSR